MSKEQQAQAEALAQLIPDRVNADADLQRRAAWFDCDWMLGVGACEFHVSQRQGRITGFERGPFFMRAWSFSLRADADAWLEFWQPVPRPGFHDILAMSKRGALVIAGNLTPMMRNLQVVKDVVAKPRADQVAKSRADQVVDQHTAQPATPDVPEPRS